MAIPSSTERRSVGDHNNKLSGQHESRQGQLMNHKLPLADCAKTNCPSSVHQTLFLWMRRDYYPMVTSGNSVPTGFMCYQAEHIKKKLSCVTGTLSEEVEEIFSCLQNPFDGLDTQYLQNKFFRENFRLLVSQNSLHNVKSRSHY